MGFKALNSAVFGRGTGAGRRGIARRRRRGMNRREVEEVEPARAGRLGQSGSGGAAQRGARTAERER